MDKNRLLWKHVMLMAVGYVLQVYGDSCDKIDSCTCEMSDGSGQVNLRSLGIDSRLTNYDYAFDIAEGGWYYKYNPCYGFVFSYFTGLAIAQADSSNYYGYDLGVQSSAYFNLTESSGLSIHYSAADALRTSRVLLICEPGTNEHNFEFVGELIITEYDFILTSPCACPGTCDDYGMIIPVTPSPPIIPVTPSSSGGNNQGVIIPDNIQVDVNHHNNEVDSSSSWLWTDVGGTIIALIFHDLLLILVIAAVVVIILNTSWCNCFQSGGGSEAKSNQNFSNIMNTNSQTHDA